MTRRRSDKRRKNDPPRDRGGHRRRNNQEHASRSTSEPCEEPTPPTDTSFNEDQKNIEKVFTALHVTPDKADEPTAVVIDQPEKTENEEGMEEKEEEGIIEEEVEYLEEEGEDELDHVVREVRAIMAAVEMNRAEESGGEVEDEQESTVVVTYDWDKLEEDVDCEPFVFNNEFNRKFAGFLLVLDPEVRHAEEIPTFETFDSDSVQKLFARLEELEYENAWPFGKRLEVSAEEVKRLFSEIHELVKFCLSLACTERGYSLRYKSKCDEPISSAWIEQLDALVELKTILAIAKEVEVELKKLEIEFDEFAEFRTISDVILPALESFDTEILLANDINDSLVTLYGRKEVGFEISEQEVDEMLELSFAEEGFGEFTVNVFNCPSLFTTAKQLKLIVPQLDKMASVIDVRVKQSAVQAITQILSVLDQEETVALMEELRDAPKVTMEKIFGFNPKTFEVGKGSEPNRSNYFKMFLTASGQKDNHIFSLKELSSALMCFYLVFSAAEVNLTILKILSAKENSILAEDRQTLTDALLTIPLELRERWEIGEEFASGEATDNEDSMYFQLRNLIQSVGSDPCETLFQFIVANHTHIVSIERIFRMCIRFIESGKHQKNSVAALKLLRRDRLNKVGLSTRFFEDLIELALSKYSVPELKSSESKYHFIDTVFTIVNKFKTEASLEIDEKAVVEKWTNCSHHWFSMLYLSNKYPVLSLRSLHINFPWLSADVWNESLTDGVADPKNYAQLAKVSTAWPNCTDMQLITNVVAEHVPHEINRADLYKEMKNYVAEFTIDETWKNSLLEKYEKKIEFLSRKSDSKKKEEVPDEAPEKVEEDPTDCIEQLLEEMGRAVEKAERPLMNLGNQTGFIMYYSEQQWSSLPDSVKKEVYRQRREQGFSNNI